MSDRLASALADRYRIERELGAGGMATVYLAHDVRHDRKVALKVLRPELSAILGGERFLAEIKTTANLQHPHILSLYDSGEADGLVFYVMPYVEGESLRDRLAREKQLPIEDAVRIAREVAGALDYAHRHGIVHRDIKPENILLHDGSALVADFGIALAVSRSDGGTRMTETGMSLGTPHYMSPEQAMGEREITPRADIYALGCVLYEMLTAEPPFTGATAQAIIARVMTEEPRSLTLQRKTIPPHVEAAVEVALAKLPADRFASAAQFAEALGKTDFAAPSTRAAAVATAARHRVIPLPRRPAGLIPWVVAAAALALAIWALTRTAPPSGVSRFTVMLGQGAELYYSGNDQRPRLALTPNGREIVYVGRQGALSHQLFLRPFDQLEARPLPGTDHALAPAVSPDGALVAFIADEEPGRVQLRVVSLRGGPPLTVVDSGAGSNPSWGSDGHVYFVDGSGRALRRVSGSGGPAETVLTLPDPGEAAQYRYLHMLPDGRGALVGAFPSNRENGAAYTLRAVDVGTGQTRETVQGVAGVYDGSGHLVYVTYDGTLMVVAFDQKALRVRGRPAAIAEGADVRLAGFTDLTLSTTGTLAYTTGGSNVTENVMWVTRTGQGGIVDPAWSDEEYESFALSPDGARVAMSVVHDRVDVWVKQLDRGPLSRLPFGGTGNANPAWTPDGRFVSFVSRRDGRRSLWRRRADGVGSEELVADVGRNIAEARWSRDGAWLVLGVNGPPSQDLFVMRLGVDSMPRPLLAEPHDEGLPALSPDGRWLAYVSTEAGQPQVFVRPFPGVDQGKWQLSTGGGRDPVWGPDGRELFWRSVDGQLIEVADMTRGPSLASRRPPLPMPQGMRFEFNAGDRMFEMGRDGRRFMLVRQGSAGDLSGDLVIVQNIQEELRATAAGRR